MQIWGHRGAYNYAPENTISSFEKAIELGADGVEFDVQLTKDGEIVVIHDEKIDRVSSGAGYVKDYTLAELKEFNFNKKGLVEPLFMTIPTLDEVLRLLRPTVISINIELKTGIIYYDDLERKTIDLVNKYGMTDRVLYSSFNHYSIQKIKQYAPNSKTALLCGGGIITTGEECEKVGASALHPSTEQMRYPGLIEDCRKRGIKVNVWTVDNDFDYLFAKDHGVDGIFVNDIVRYNEKIKLQLTERELAIYNKLEDEVSHSVFYARKKFAQYGEACFRDVFDKPEQFDAIRSVVQKHQYAIYGAGIITRRAYQTLLGWDAWRNCVAIYDRDGSIQGQEIGGIKISAPPKEHMPINYILNGVYVGNTEGYRSAIEYLNDVGVTHIFDTCHIVDNIPLQYFDKEIIIPHLSSNEVFIDGGCYDFCTSKRLTEITPNVKKIYAFESAVEMLPYIQREIDDLEFQNVQLENAALWSSNMELNCRFNKSGSCISIEGTKVRAVALDSFIPTDERVTFLKLDIEGSELEALKGARRIISEQYPKLAICVYHKPNDYIDIAEYIMTIAPKYKIYMRQYSSIDVETVLYAVI